jgi:cobalt/nickel transport system ATP-binding protein
MGTFLMDTVLQVSHVSYHYPDGHRVIQDVNFQLHSGERLAIIGPNGAGKSTLFFCLNGIFQSEGDILVLGEKMEAKTLGTIRQNIGLVFQEPHDQLFMPTVFEDVAFGPINMGCSEADVRERVQRALRQVGMDGSEALTPYHLSVGQRKKIAVATVLAMDPQILAFDEPSSGLDPRSRRQLIHFLKELPQPQLIATHDLDLVLDVCQRVLILDDGRIVGEGIVPEIFEQERLLTAHGLERPLRMQKI